MMLALSIPIPSLTNTLVFVGALMVCAMLTKLVLKHQGNLGMDQPDGERKKHGRAISRLGGLPIFITMMLGVIYLGVFGRETEREWWGVMLCNALIFFIGLADDFKPLGARLKLLGQVGVALILYGMGGSIDVISHPTLAKTSIELGWWSPLLTVAWLIAVPNIINLIDGMDGLAAGFGLFLSLTLAFVGHTSGMPDVVILATVMAGALAGFLLFNFPPAKIFLGDGGAYMLGFFVASVSLHTSRKGFILGPMLVMVVAMGVPILDTAFAIMRRGLRGVPVFSADAEHIHHRLISLGYTKGQALGILYAVCAVLSLLGIYVLSMKGQGIVLLTALLALGGLAAARMLGYVRSFRGLRRQWQQAFDRRRDVEFARSYGRVLQLEADRMETPVEYAELLTRTLKRLNMALQPEHGREPMETPLPTMGGVWRVGLADVDIAPERMRARLEALVPGVDRALERWSALPHVTWIPAPKAPPAVETTAASSPH
jgi:UDP-GlcNAc:undecaprenyl-phosphate/decaprenyl-phosphate GlcNAc-1-phosphate transferase